MEYDYYIGIDWAKENMAMARMTGKTGKLKVHEGPSDVRGLGKYLDGLRGTKILTLEESGGAQWLYTKLKPHVERLIVCDPRRNRLLSEGPKTDRIDAVKLVKLLKANLLKEVYHSGDDLIHVRRMVRGYINVVRAGVRLKNQRSALFLGIGKDHKKDKELDHSAEMFVLLGLDAGIESYEKEKKRYEKEFTRLAKTYRPIRLVKSLPGIATIGAVKLVATMVDPRRFKTSGHFLSYCGLVKLDRISGGKCYGRKKSQHSRVLKEVFKTGAMAAIQEGRNNPLRNFYCFLIEAKNYPEHHARHAAARRLAVWSWGVLKSGKTFDVKEAFAKKKEVK